MVDKIINGMVSAIVGAVSFVAVRALVDGMDNTSWSSAEVTMWETIVPLTIAIMVVVGLFLGVTRMRGV